ncbi:MAG: T9SS type A sorting domain-containing protein, partial [Lentimicrobium sp.]|nr:T9SS type A sorting domain-containing protein [Lentimicrobium sp.]
INFRIGSGIAATAAITIIDISGKQVFMKENYRLSQGFNTFNWNGRESSGKVIKPGIYFLNVKSAGTKATVKFVVL